MDRTNSRDRQLRERAAAVIPGGMYGHQAVGLLPDDYPQFFEKGEGAHIWDVDGRRYLDFMCAYGPNLFGYANPQVDAAYVRQLGLGDTLTGPTALMVEMAEAMVGLVSHASWAMFCKNGTDATSMALTIARAHTKRKTVIRAKGAYHGAAPWCTPRPSGVIDSDRAHQLICDYNDVATLEAAAAEAGDDLACIFAAPFKHDAFIDQHEPDLAYARMAREICDRTGALLIVDDVRAGLRRARDCSWSLIGVQPDLSSWGKCIANGHPISALMGSEIARKAAASIYVTGSFWYQAAPMAAGLETLRLVKDTDYLERIAALGQRLRDGLSERADAAGFSFRQTGPVTMPLFLFDADPDLRKGFCFSSEMLARGVYVHPWHNMFLCAAMTEQDIDAALDAAEGAFGVLKRNVRELAPVEKLAFLFRRSPLMDDYSDYDGLGLAELVARKQVTAAELVEAAIDRIERHNPTLNAVVFKAYDDARKQAARALPDGPFKGVPFLIKDLAMPVAGWPRTSGSRFARDVVDRVDCGLTTRYRQSGVIPLGKTNTPEYGITGTTESALLGPCRNPWNPDHIAGGSSGGSASAVAAGIVPLAHASDGLGSIRIPAACCGLVGLKVTRDRNPNLPDGFDYAFGNVVDHVVSRTVRDSAAMLDATGWPEPGSPYPAPPKARPYMQEVQASPGRMRIAWSAETPNGRPIHDEVQAALEDTAALLKSLGHEVIERGLGIDYRALYASRGPAAAANFAAGMARLIAEIGREPELDELEGLTWASLKVGRRQTGADVMYSLQETRMLNRATLAAFDDIDVYLCPVMGEPPPEIGFLSPVLHEPKEVNKRQGRIYPYTPPFNFSGQPSISLPLAQSKSGLPIGMMFTAKFADEATLFRLAAQLEKEAPWKDRRPKVWG